MINGAMWSLSVEEHFYLVWPLVVHRLKLRTVVIIGLAVCAIEPVVRAVCFAHVQSVYAYTWFRLDGLACGALMACMTRSSGYSVPRAQRLSMLMAIAGIVLLAAGAPFGILERFNRFGTAFQFVPINLLCSAAVLFGVDMSGSRATVVLRNPLLKLAADLSYCLYLIHFLVIDAYDKVLKTLHFAPAISSFEGIAIPPPW